MFKLKNYIFVLAIFSLLIVLTNSLHQNFGYGHTSFAGLHILGSARNINYFNSLTPFTWYADSSNFILYNHHPFLFFLIFGKLALIFENKFDYLIVSRIISSLFWTLGSYVTFILLKNLFKNFSIKSPKINFIATVSSLSPLFSANSLHYTNLTSFDMFSFPLSAALMLGIVLQKINYIYLIIPLFL